MHCRGSCSGQSCGMMWRWTTTGPGHTTRAWASMWPLMQQPDYLAACLSLLSSPYPHQVIMGLFLQMFPCLCFWCTHQVTTRTLPMDTLFVLLSPPGHHWDSSYECSFFDLWFLVSPPEVIVGTLPMVLYVFFVFVLPPGHH